MAISKVVFPMQKVKQTHPKLKMDRIYTNCQTQTSTGRISLHEPNIQNIPRDFDIACNERLIVRALGAREAKRLKQSINSSNSRSAMSSFASFLDNSPVCDRNQNYLVSMRHAIVPCRGFVILAADYSQLELRILAHLSKDQKLTRILNEGKDVFKSIAASWKRTDVEQVINTALLATLTSNFSFL